jgi:hypothetical protein
MCRLTIFSPEMTQLVFAGYYAPDTGMSAALVIDLIP